MLLCLLPFVILFDFIVCDRTSFQVYYSTKTIDEVRYILVAFETFIARQDSSFKGKRELLSTLNKNELTDYTYQLVSQRYPGFEVIENFNRTIVAYPKSLTIDSIIDNGERQFLYKWAINAEKYHRRQTQTSNLLGGLIDYAQYMKTPDLKAYIRRTLAQYPPLNTRPSFDEEILNIKPYKESVFLYIQEAPIDVIKYWINNLELYLSSVYNVASSIGHEATLNPSSPKTELQKNMYNALKNYSQLLQIDNFLQVLDYKNDKYIPMSLDAQSDQAIQTIALGCEEYYRRQKSFSKSFRGLMLYHERVPINSLKSYSMHIINEYPELSNFKLIDDLAQNSRRQNFGKVKDNVNQLPRKELIRSILNAQTIENATSKASGDLNELFRMKDEALRERLLNISIRNPALQTQVKMQSAVELHNSSLEVWLEQMPHSILGEIGYNLTNLFSPKEIFCRKFFSDNTDKEIIDRILTLSKTHNITSPKDIELKMTNNNGPLYRGMHSYFMSINKETLFVWIKQFEQYHRQIRKLTSIVGGVSKKNLEKKYYIGKLFYYLDKYPKYKDPVEFDYFVGMDKAHKVIHDKETKYTLGEIAIALNRYHQRMSPNLHYSMNLDHYYADIKKADRTFLFFYSFKIMAIYPELNLPEIFEEVLDIPNTANISIFLNHIFGEKIIYSALNVQRYLNELFNRNDTTPLETMDDIELKNYIQARYLRSNMLKIDFGRLVNGQSEYLYWNYEEFFHRQTLKDLQLFAERMKVYDQAANEETPNRDEPALRKYLNGKMSKLPQLHNPSLFDKVINYVQADNTVKQEYIDMLNALPRHELMRFSLVVEHLHHFSHSTIIYPRVWNYIVSATKNELIRHICSGIPLKYNISTYNDLVVYSRHLFLDYGEMSILDLVEFR